jgi:hypothetical protein
VYLNWGAVVVGPEVFGLIVGDNYWRIIFDLHSWHAGSGISPPPTNLLVPEYFANSTPNTYIFLKIPLELGKVMP